MTPSQYSAQFGVKLALLSALDTVTLRMALYAYRGMMATDDNIEMAIDAVEQILVCRRDGLALLPEEWR